MNQKVISPGAALAFAMAVLSAPASAAVDAMVGASSIYLWRGVDQGDGTPSIYGDLLLSGAGFYGSVWATSGGIQDSEEVDLIAGWSGDMGPLMLDVGAVNYFFPTGTDDSVQDFSEAYAGIGIGGLEFYYFKQVAGRHLRYDDNQYYSLAYSGRRWSILIGENDREEPAGQRFSSDYRHVDISYAYNDNLSFTVSKVIEVDDEFNANSSASGGTGIDDDTLFVVSYEFPLL